MENVSCGEWYSGMKRWVILCGNHQKWLVRKRRTPFLLIRQIPLDTVFRAPGWMLTLSLFSSAWFEGENLSAKN